MRYARNNCSKMSRLFIGAVLLVLSVQAYALDPNSRFCFRDVINTPDTYMLPPSIDGVVAGDNGWTSAWQYVFNNGTYIHDAVVQGIKDNNFVYLSFEIAHDPNKDTADAIVIAIDPNTTGAVRRMLHIYPFGSSATATPVLLNYFTFTGSPWAPAELPTGTVASATVSGTSGNFSWVVEVKIPRSGFGISSSNDFGLYFNAMAVRAGGLALDYPWPVGTASMVTDLQNTPPVNSWGTASVGPATCNGVSIAASDIRTDNSPPSKINLNAPNTFYALVRNNTINGAGAHVPANGIRATFKIANFGLPSMWQPVPATAPATNPTSAVNIPANSTADLTTTWTLSMAERTAYTANPHQCMLVELDTTATVPPETTVFSNKSAWTNMNFGVASTFNSKPEIDPRGWKQPPAGQAKQRVNLLVTQQIDQLVREDVLKSMTGQRPETHAAASERMSQKNDGTWTSLKYLSQFPVNRDENFKEFLALLEKPSIQISQLTYLVHGCRRSGEFIKIQANTYELCERVGSYGYVVRHAGLGQAKWSVALEGPGLERGKHGLPDLYDMQLSPNQPVQLLNSFKAKDSLTDGGGGSTGCGKFGSGSAGLASAGLGLIWAGVYGARRRKPKK